MSATTDTTATTDEAETATFYCEVSPSLTVVADGLELAFVGHYLDTADPAAIALLSSGRVPEVRRI